MAKKQGNQTVEAAAKQQEVDITSVLKDVKAARDASLKVVNNCRSIIKLSTFGNDVFVEEMAARVTGAMHDAHELSSKAANALTDAAATFAPYEK